MPNIKHCYFCKYRNRDGGDYPNHKRCKTCKGFNKFVRDTKQDRRLS